MLNVVLLSCWYLDGKPSSKSASAFSQIPFPPVNLPLKSKFPSRELTSRIPVCTNRSSPPNRRECEPRVEDTDCRKFVLRGVWNCGTEVVRPIRRSVPPG